MASLLRRQSVSRSVFQVEDSSANRSFCCGPSQRGGRLPGVDLCLADECSHHHVDLYGLHADNLLVVVDIFSTWRIELQVWTGIQAITMVSRLTPVLIVAVG